MLEKKSTALHPYLTEGMIMSVSCFKNQAGGMNEQTKI